MMIWPGITIGTVAVLFAFALCADAAVLISAVFKHGTEDRALLAIRATIEACAAVAAIAYPGLTAAIMTVIAGLYAITTGGLELAVYGRLTQHGAKPSG